VPHGLRPCAKNACIAHKLPCGLTDGRALNCLSCRKRFSRAMPGLAYGNENSLSADHANVTFLISKMILSYNLVHVQYVPAPPRKGRLA
jgi:hypothetical protein